VWWTDRAAKARKGLYLARWGHIKPRTAVAEGLKVPEQELGIMSTENMLKSQNGPLLGGCTGLTSPEGSAARARGRRRQGGGGILPRTAGVDGFRVNDQSNSV
jgi:hypothetical protein